MCVWTCELEAVPRLICDSDVEIGRLSYPIENAVFCRIRYYYYPTANYPVSLQQSQHSRGWTVFQILRCLSPNRTGLRKEIQKRDFSQKNLGCFLLRDLPFRMEHGPFQKPYFLRAVKTQHWFLAPCFLNPFTMLIWSNAGITIFYCLLCQLQSCWRLSAYVL